MSRLGSLGLCYNVDLKCKLPKILLTTKMIQHSESMHKRRVETQFQTKKIDAEYFYGIVWREFTSKVILLQVSHGTLGRCLRNPSVPRNPS